MSDSSKPKPDEPLQAAFALLDETSAKLDTLKAAFNSTVKEADGLKKAVTPIPFDRKKLNESGRYSAQKLDSERPFAVKPRVPRPTPKLAPAPPAHTSGRFYIQIPEGASNEVLREFREQLSQLGRVVDSGRGTAANPKAGWVELAVRDTDTPALIAKLREKALEERVEKVIEVEPGEGRLQARQLDLFRLKLASSSSES